MVHHDRLNFCTGNTISAQETGEVVVSFTDLSLTIQRYN
jgi:hypothetical protein